MGFLVCGIWGLRIKDRLLRDGGRGSGKGNWHPNIKKINVQS
jgi:hypothetical protein